MKLLFVVSLYATMRVCLSVCL